MCGYTLYPNIQGHRVIKGATCIHGYTGLYTNTRRTVRSGVVLGRVCITRLIYVFFACKAYYLMNAYEYNPCV